MHICLSLPACKIAKSFQRRRLFENTVLLTQVRGRCFDKPSKFTIPVQSAIRTPLAEFPVHGAATSRISSSFHTSSRNDLPFKWQRCLDPHGQLRNRCALVWSVPGIHPHKRRQCCRSERKSAALAVGEGWLFPPSGKGAGNPKSAVTGKRPGLRETEASDDRSGREYLAAATGSHNRSMIYCLGKPGTTVSDFHRERVLLPRFAGTRPVVPDSLD